MATEFPPVSGADREQFIREITAILVVTEAEPWLLLKQLRTVNERRCIPPLPDAFLVSTAEGIAHQERDFLARR